MFFPRRPPPPPPPPPSPTIMPSLIIAMLVTAICTIFWCLRRRRLPVPTSFIPPKVGFTSSRLPQRVDVVIIGSGPGGLAAASTLAQRGKSCLVLEANETLGGGLHIWEDGGVPFDTGFHYLGEVQNKHSPLRLVIDYLAGGAGMSYTSLADCPHFPGIYDEVTFQSDGRCMRFSPGEEAWRMEYKRHFPGCEGVIDAFREACIAHAPTFLPSVIWRSPLEEVSNGTSLGVITRVCVYTSTVWFTWVSALWGRIHLGVTSTSPCPPCLPCSPYASPTPHISCLTHARFAGRISRSQPSTAVYCAASPNHSCSAPRRRQIVRAPLPRSESCLAAPIVPTWPALSPTSSPAAAVSGPRTGVPAR